MAVLDSPFVPDPARVVGTASYRFTEEAFLAGCRAWWMTRFPGYGSPLLKLVGFVGLHLMLLAGIGLFIAEFAGPKREGEGEGASVMIALYLTIMSAWLLWVFLYGFRRRLRRLYLKYGVAGREVALTFTPERLIVQTPQSEASEDWSFYRGAVELRDGFLLRHKAFVGGVWIPDDALHAPFNHQSAAAFFRASLPEYRVLNRRARLVAERAPDESVA
ncbi:hypothetical protein [Planctomyces sp. SH-PL62]|uniref:hypothetical protein n=1 Tax=Planctomyces sp. SH-PL62 TaxID=1636152 RepID=UPI00078E631C|nr:hypothetical protein [Planctomyces sp. SH-PL62]AMV35873.1 hypothetical protein VT85_00415 [Planctomyces sp. SH-PL62]